jgi:NAD(P)-dependent dehydrogenase (short-subunit alcohol dehydrogenase family)
MCARSSTKGAAAISSIQELYPHANVTLLIMDHLSLSTVVSAAKLFLSRESALHGLVNNAGIMATPFEMTADGYEAQWQTNHLAHWVFTAHLLPLMRATAKALTPGSVRIVNLSSSGHYQAPKGGILFADTSLPKDNGMTRYGQSKLANILHAKTLHKLYGPGSASSMSGEGEIWTSVVHPGLVATQIGRAVDWPRVLTVAVKVYSSLGGRIDADTGAFTSLFCIASPQMKREQSGTYFQRVAEPGWQSGMAKNTVLSDGLEEWTAAEMKAKYFLPSRV